MEPKSFENREIEEKGGRRAPVKTTIKKRGRGDVIEGNEGKYKMVPKEWGEEGAEESKHTICVHRFGGVRANSR